MVDRDTHVCRLLKHYKWASFKERYSFLCHKQGVLISARPCHIIKPFPSSPSSSNPQSVISPNSSAGLCQPCTNDFLILSTIMLLNSASSRHLTSFSGFPAIAFVKRGRTLMLNVQQQCDTFRDRSNSRIPANSLPRKKKKYVSS